MTISISDGLVTMRGGVINFTHTPAIPAPSATLEDSILAGNPTHYWKLNETSGTTAVDTMGNANLTYMSAASTGGYSVASSRFDGVGAAKKIDTGVVNDISQTIKTENESVGIPTGSDFTIELAFNMSSYDTTMTLFASNGGVSGIQLNISNTDKLQVTVVDSTYTGDMARTTDSLAIMGITTSGEWHWISGRMDYAGNLLDLYIDGVQRATRVPMTNGIPAIPNAIYGTAIGVKRQSGTGYAPWGGSIDEVAFYDHAISDLQRATNYNLWKTGSV